MNDGLKKALKKAGITRRELARYIGMDLITMNNQLNHATKPEKFAVIATAAEELMEKKKAMSGELPQHLLLPAKDIEDMDAGAFGRELIRIRNLRCLTRREIAERTGVADIQLRRAESGTFCVYDRTILYDIYAGKEEKARKAMQNYESIVSSDYSKTEVTWPVRLRKARMKRKMTQFEAATYLGIGHSTLAGWEAGRYTPNYYWPEQVIDYLSGKRKEPPDRLAARETLWSKQEKCWVRLDRQKGAVRIYHEGEEEKEKELTPYQERLAKERRKAEEQREKSLAIYATPWGRAGMTEEAWRWQNRMIEEDQKQARRMKRAAERKIKLKRTWPDGIEKTCVICGAPISGDRYEPIRCEACRSAMGKRPKGATPKEEKLYNDKQMGDMHGTMKLSGDYYQWRCLGCAHAETLGASMSVACMYLTDKILHGLPKRPRPSGPPCECIYKSIHEDCCTDIPPQRAMDIYRAGKTALMDKQTAKIYINEKELAAAGLDKDDKRLRQLKPEERSMLRYQFMTGGRKKHEKRTDD